MKKFCILIFLPMVLISFNVMAADISGWWEVTDTCIDVDDPVLPYDYETHDVYIFMIDNEFFTAGDSEDPLTHGCQGVLQGRSFHMTCVDGPTPTFAYGRARRNKIMVVNHILSEGRTCTAVGVRSDPPE